VLSGPEWEGIGDVVVFEHHLGEPSVVVCSICVKIGRANRIKGTLTAKTDPLNVLSRHVSAARALKGSLRHRGERQPLQRDTPTTSSGGNKNIHFLEVTEDLLH
jgi:hypothetical protein